METLDESMPINIGKYEIDWDAIDEHSDPFKITTSLNKSQMRSPGKTIGATSLETSRLSSPTPNGIPNFKENSVDNTKVSQLSLNNHQAYLNCKEDISNSLNNSLHSLADETSSFTNTTVSCEELNEGIKEVCTKDLNSTKKDKELNNYSYHNSQDSLDDKTLNEVYPQNDSIIMNHSFLKSSKISDEQESYQCQLFMENDEAFIKNSEIKASLINENPLLDLTVLPTIYSTENKNITENETCKKPSINDFMDTSIYLGPQINYNSLTTQPPSDDQIQNEEFCDSNSFDFLQKISHGGDVNAELRDSIYLKFDPYYEKGASPAQALLKIGEFIERRASKSPATSKPLSGQINRTPSPCDLSQNALGQFATMTKTRAKVKAPNSEFDDEIEDEGCEDNLPQTVVKVPIRNLAATSVRRQNATTNHEADQFGAKKESKHVTRSLDESVLLLKGTPPPSGNFGHEVFNSGTIVLNKKKCVSTNPTSDSLFIGPLDYSAENVKELSAGPTSLQPSSSSTRVHDKPVSAPEAPSSSQLLQWQSKRLLLEREIATLKNKCSQFEEGKGSEIESLTKALELLEAYKILLLKNGPSPGYSPKPPGSSSSPQANVTPHDQDYGELLKEKNQLAEDVKGVEVAFADLHRRYEKLKVNLENYKTNEEILRKSLVEKDEKMSAQLALHENYVNHANTVLHEANAEIGKVKGDQKAENMALQAKLKMLEMKTQSLERDLSEKIKENHQLTTMYEELVSDMATK